MTDLLPKRRLMDKAIRKLSRYHKNLSTYQMTTEQIDARKKKAEVDAAVAKADDMLADESTDFF